MGMALQLHLHPPSKIPVVSFISKLVYSSAEWTSWFLAGLCHPFQSLSLEQSRQLHQLPVIHLEAFEYVIGIPHVVPPPPCSCPSRLCLILFICLFTITLGEYLRGTRKNAYIQSSILIKSCIDSVPFLFQNGHITPYPRQRSAWGEPWSLPILILGPGVKTVCLLSQRRPTETVSELSLTQEII